MNRKSLFLMAVVLLFSSAVLTAQVRTTKPNDITFELGGKCLLYSMGYQRTLTPNLALDLTLSYFGAGGGGDSVGAFFLGGGGRFYLIKKDASPYISGGLVWLSAGTDAGPFGDDSSSGVYFYASPGFEFRMSSGFLFRAGAYFLIKGGFFVWPGRALGVCF